MSHKRKVIFNAADLVPVIEEAKANKCAILLVKDHGLYMMSEKGAINDNTGKRRVAYAEGFNPDVVEFDDWYPALHDICGGDDFCEYLKVSDPLFDTVLSTRVSLMVEFSLTSIILQTVLRSSEKQK
ncbi:DUF3085 domain-containing protein [Salmonella enterica subsp. diarizonae]|uniref:DUF3085 domain-containing protein n=1 Tax=Salmonella diarizonae TaxID=59204 RepID=A0A6C8Y4A2_SALDZ|nr:DUF3085 domain-containing protein [Salmonella enterica subsp. diarizonae]